MDVLNDSKKSLVAALRAVPQIPQNAQLIQTLQRMIRSKNLQREFFIYNAVFAGLTATGTAGAIATQNINIQADAHFLIQATAYHANVAAAGQTVSSFTYPLVSVLLTDSGSGRNLMDQDVSVPDMFGNGQFPFVWPQAKLMQANSNLTVRVTNYDAAQTYNLRLAFIGTKIFDLTTGPDDGDN